MSESSAQRASRLIVVSNRLPVVLTQHNGRVIAQPASGGLVTALSPALQNRGGVWIGWPGAGEPDTVRQALRSASRGAGYTLEPVVLSDELVAGYYYGFSNEIIWPLFHDLPSRCNFVPGYWSDYQEANLVFARAIEQAATPEDFVWVHDYHLLDVARQLDGIGSRRRTGFFLHIPFPPVDLYIKLPWRFEVLRGLLDFDMLGFQTARDTRNFVDCVRSLLPDVEIRGRRGSFTMSTDKKRTMVGSFPIGIDARDFEARARSADVEREVRLATDRLSNMRVVLGVDRLDYTKGLPERLVAFGEALRQFPELQGTTTLIQVVVPSREDVPEYQSLRAEVERLVGEINGEFTEPGWAPIHYIYRPLSQTELLAYYRMADVCLVTPLKDGMNLVSKEYCACNIDGDGVLILSEFAGSAAQLHRGAIMVNPHDIEGTARAIQQAMTMPSDERRARMRRLRSIVRRDDIHWWTDMFLRAAISKRVEDLGSSDFFVPSPDGIGPDS